MISLRRPALIAVSTLAIVVIVVVGLMLAYYFMPDSWRYRHEMARAEQAAVKIEAFRQKSGHYPDEKDRQAFKSMGLQFDRDFFYVSSGPYNSTPEAPFLIFVTDYGCSGGSYDLTHKHWVFMASAC